MKSKEEMIEAMAISMQEVNTFGVASYTLMAEAALKALCGALPDVEQKEILDIDIKSPQDLETYLLLNMYNQLKQWGE